MSRMEKFKVALALIIIILLCYGIYGVTRYVANINQQLQQLQTVVAQRPIKGIDGANGNTPVKGVDYFDGTDGTDGRNGANGKNSTSTSTTIIEQQAVPGPAGSNGASAPELQLRVNPDTGDVEQGYAGDSFWTILIPCQQLLVGCPVTAPVTNTLNAIGLGL